MYETGQVTEKPQIRFEINMCILSFYVFYAFLCSPNFPPWLSISFIIRQSYHLKKYLSVRQQFITGKCSVLHY